MGKVQIEGCENTLWCPITFVSYLHKHKILTAKIKYDYEKSEQDEVKVAIGVFNENHKQGVTGQRRDPNQSNKTHMERMITHK